MRRRDYLAGLTGCISTIGGCLGGNSLRQGPNFEERTIALVGVDEEPTEYDLEVSVEVDEPKITRTHTAEVELTIENTGSSKSPGIGISEEGLDQLSPVESDYSNSPEDEIWLIPLALEQPDPWNGCWTTEEAGGPWNGGAAQADMKLQPGEFFSQKYRLWDPSPDTPCMPVGEYKYGNRLTEVDEPGPGWMFTISVNKP